MTIYIGNLSFQAEQEHLFDLFSEYGDVKNCSLPLDRETGRKRGFAFVEMVNDADEQKAIDDLQDVEWMGRMIRVSKATPTRAHRRPSWGWWRLPQLIQSSDFGVQQISFSLLIAQAVEEASALVGRLRHQVLGQSMLRKHGSESASLLPCEITVKTVERPRTAHGTSIGCAFVLPLIAGRKPFD